MDQISVFLIGRKSMCVEGLAAILGTFSDVELVGRSFDWKEGVERAAALTPDVTIVDLAHCPECGTSTPAAAIRELGDLNVIVLSAAGVGPSVVDAMEAGALGYVVLDAVDTSSLHETIAAAAVGQANLDTRLSTAVLSRMRSMARRAAVSGTRDVPPTERETEVLQLLVKGCSNREIANRLHVSESTVKNHLHAIYSKLGADSRSHAVSEAIKRGIAEP